MHKIYLYITSFSREIISKTNFWVEIISFDDSIAKDISFRILFFIFLKIMY